MKMADTLYELSRYRIRKLFQAAVQQGDPKNYANNHKEEVESLYLFTIHSYGARLSIVGLK